MTGSDLVDILYWISWPSYRCSLIFSNCFIFFRVWCLLVTLGVRQEYTLEGMSIKHIHIHILIHTQGSFRVDSSPSVMFLDSERKLENTQEIMQNSKQTRVHGRTRVAVCCNVSQPPLYLSSIVFLFQWVLQSVSVLLGFLNTYHC